MSICYQRNNHVVLTPKKLLSKASQNNTRKKRFGSAISLSNYGYTDSATELKASILKNRLKTADINSLLSMWTNPSMEYSTRLFNLGVPKELTFDVRIFTSLSTGCSTEAAMLYSLHSVSQRTSDDNAHSFSMVSSSQFLSKESA